jgi:hypothetical protein
LAKPTYWGRGRFDFGTSNQERDDRAMILGVKAKSKEAAKSYVKSLAARALAQGGHCDRVFEDVGAEAVGSGTGSFTVFVTCYGVKQAALLIDALHGAKAAASGDKHDKLTAFGQGELRRCRTCSGRGHAHTQCTIATCVRFDCNGPVAPSLLAHFRRLWPTCSAFAGAAIGASSLCCFGHLSFTADAPAPSELRAELVLLFQQGFLSRLPVEGLAGARPPCCGSCGLLETDTPTRTKFRNTVGSPHLAGGTRCPLHPSNFKMVNRNDCEPCGDGTANVQFKYVIGGGLWVPTTESMNLEDAPGRSPDSQGRGSCP